MTGSGASSPSRMTRSRLSIVRDKRLSPPVSQASSFTSAMWSPIYPAIYGIGFLAVCQSGTAYHTNTTSFGAIALIADVLTWGHHICAAVVGKCLGRRGSSLISSVLPPGGMKGTATLTYEIALRFSDFLQYWFTQLKEGLYPWQLVDYQRSSFAFNSAVTILRIFRLRSENPPRSLQALLSVRPTLNPIASNFGISEEAPFTQLFLLVPRPQSVPSLVLLAASNTPHMMV